MSRSNAPIRPALSARLRRSRSLRSCLLGMAALGDVRHDADQSMRLAVRRARRDESAARQPDDRAVGPHDPVLGGKRIDLVGQRMEAPRQMAIVRMHRGLVLIGVAADLAAPAGQIDPEQRHALVRPGPRAGAQVGFPRAHAAGGQRRPVARLALAQRLLGAPGGGDVEEGRDRLERPAVDREHGQPPPRSSARCRRHRAAAKRSVAVDPCCPSFEQGRFDAAAVRLRRCESARRRPAREGPMREPESIAKPTTRSKLSLA